MSADAGAWTGAGAPAAIGRAAAIAALTAPGAVGELVEIDAGGRRVRWFAQPPASTLRELIESTASDLPFLQYRDERWTFAEAWQDAARIARVMQDLGVQQGDRVAIAMRNYPEWVLGFTAAVSLGAVSVAMNAHWTADELAHALNDCEARLLIADAERIERWRVAAADDQRLAGIGVLGVRLPPATADAASAAPSGPGATATATLDGAVPTPRFQRWEQALAAAGARGSADMPQVAIAPDDLALMLYTSGSTGHPKGVPSTHRNVLAGLFSWELDKAIGELAEGIVPPVPAQQPGTLLAVPLFHVTGLHASYLAGYRAQRRMVCMYRWDAEEAARLIEAGRLTSVVAPSAVTGDLVRVAREGRFDLSSLQLVGGGGAPRPPEQVAEIGERFGAAQPNIGWGMTETNAIGCGHGGPDYLQRPTSSGRPSLLLDLRVVDDDGQALPNGERGELQVRGTSIFGGYWRRPEANAQAFTADGWFRTGDVALIDAEGFVYIVDRIKDLIIRGGENIGCGAVEAALMKHPAVHEAAVYGVPDERLGEEVGATVMADAGLDADALRTFAAQHLARFEVPRYLTIRRDPLPRTASGKLLKRQLRDEALAALGQALRG